MTKRLKPLIIGNWKQNPATGKRAEKLLVDIQKGLSGRRGASLIAVAPPLPFLGDLQQLAGSQKIEFAAQDVSVYEEGAHTGEVSAAQLRSVGVRCAVIGHSERRADGETDDDVNAKIAALLSVKSAAVLCVGERERDSYGDYFTFVESQLKTALKGVKAADLKNIIIAYEPVWAIGTGQNAAAEDVAEMKLFIQKIISDLYSREAALRVRVIYGGSVTPENAEELLAGGTADGFLVGGASLEAKKFVAIVKIADHYAKFA